MKRNDRTGSHLFFIEFIIVLFFFLIVSTVCLRLFARAHEITRRADALSHAQAAAASVAAAVEDVIQTAGQEAAATTAEKTQNAATDTSSADDPKEASDRGIQILQTVSEYLPGASLSQLPDSILSKEGLVILYDREFQPCTAEDARYLLTAAIHTEEQEETMQISVLDYNQVLVYELSVSLHCPLTRKEALQ